MIVIKNPVHFEDANSIILYVLIRITSTYHPTSY